jgi:hypothetical protein
MTQRQIPKSKMENFKLGKRKRSTNVKSKGQSQVNFLFCYQKSYPLLMHSSKTISQTRILLAKYGTHMEAYLFNTSPNFCWISELYIIPKSLLQSSEANGQKINTDSWNTHCTHLIWSSGTSFCSRN